LKAFRVPVLLIVSIGSSEQRRDDPLRLATIRRVQRKDDPLRLATIRRVQRKDDPLRLATIRRVQKRTKIICIQV